MTYDIYAVYQEGSYKVSESTHAEHGMDHAQRVCKSIKRFPMGIAAITRNEGSIRGPIFNLNDLKTRKDI